MSYSAVTREFPVTPLANMLAGCTRQMIADIVAEIMTTERVLVLNQIPLDPIEFIPVMLKYPKTSPVSLIDQYHNWYTRYTTMGVKRTLKLEQNKEQRKQMKRKPRK